MDIEAIAVIGAGVMGSGIAAQAANAGARVWLLDIVPEGASDRDSLAKTALRRLATSDPPSLMHADYLRRITPGNLEDHGSALAEADWIIEAVVERREIKQSLYRTLGGFRKPGSVVSSNTSTLPLAELTQGLPEAFRRDFLISHFFNPPRYMPLVELVAGPDTRPEAVAAVSAFADRRLGKSIIPCKDTPGFIANRIGVYWLQLGMLEAMRLGLSVEEADAVISSPFGIPKTGIFGLLDLVGLDLVPQVIDSMTRRLPPHDPLQAIGPVPELVRKLVAEGYTGRKGKGGFYRLNGGGAGKLKEALDLRTGAYRPSRKPSGRLPSGLRAFLHADTPAARYARSVMLRTLAYAASVGPDIADDLEVIDRAMRLGYRWQYGPFELMDKLGVEWLAQALADLGQPLPDWLGHAKTVYRVDAGQLAYRDFQAAGQWRPLRREAGVLRLADIQRRGPPLERNVSASLWDIGDGVLCLEFHSKMNSLDSQSLTLTRQALAVVAKGYRALVIYNEGEHFSAGANLGILLFGANIGLWDEVAKLLELGQEVFTAIKYAPFPVVGAPSGLALGAGCEILLHCDAIQAHAELYMGLVETGVGLIPGWGGCKEMLLRSFADSRALHGPVAPIARIFATLSTAVASKSAYEARDLLFLGAKDGITMNRDRLLYEAKAKALTLAEHYQPPEPQTLRLPGPAGRAALDMAIQHYRRLGKATAYDAVVAEVLAMVLTGGETADISRLVTESEVLALERKACLSLIKREPTLARVAHMLETGKPLRN